MDRTSEFFSIVDQRRSQQSIVHPPRPPITRSEFTAEASEIGAAIYATAEKLGKLTQLAKSKSLFEDPTAEINAMTALIKTEIVSLNSKLAELKGRQHASRTKQRESHSTSVVESLSSQLRGATRDFQDVLHTRSANLKLLQAGIPERSVHLVDHWLSFFMVRELPRLREIAQAYENPREPPGAKTSRFLNLF